MNRFSDKDDPGKVASKELRKTSTNGDNPSFNFMLLTPELRNNVYRSLLSAPLISSYTWRYQPSGAARYSRCCQPRRIWRSNYQLNILRACRLVYQEARQVFHEKNNFIAVCSNYGHLAKYCDAYGIHVLAANGQPNTQVPYVMLLQFAYLNLEEIPPHAWPLIDDDNCDISHFRFYIERLDLPSLWQMLSEISARDTWQHTLANSRLSVSLKRPDCRMQKRLLCSLSDIRGLGEVTITGAVDIDGAEKLCKRLKSPRWTLVEMLEYVADLRTDTFQILHKGPREHAAAKLRDAQAILMRGCGPYNGLEVLESGKFTNKLAYNAHAEMFAYVLLDNLAMQLRLGSIEETRCTIIMLRSVIDNLEDPDFRAAVYPKLFYLTAKCYRLHGVLEGARTAITTALTLDPNNIDYFMEWRRLKFLWAIKPKPLPDGSNSRNVESSRLSSGSNESLLRGLFAKWRS